MDPSNNATIENHLRLDDVIVVWFLCGMYSVLTVLPFIQLLRLHLRSPNPGWSILKLFLAFTTVASLVRAVLFGIIVYLHIKNFFLDIGNDTAFTILINIPRVIYISAFSLLLLFWAEIIHRVKNHMYSFDKKRTCFITANVVIYFLQVAFWIPVFFFTQWSNDVYVPFIENFFFSLLSLVVGILFVYFGGRLFFILKAFPIQSTERTSKLIEVGSVTLICSFSFLIRAILLLVTSFPELVTTLDMNAYVILVYYVMVEGFPFVSVLAIFSRLPEPTVHSDSESAAPNSGTATSDDEDTIPGDFSNVQNKVYEHDVEHSSMTLKETQNYFSTSRSEKEVRIDGNTRYTPISGDEGVQ